jgi:hypothetical protein
VSEHPDIRASDADRKAVVDELTRHCGEGRLTLEETEERVEVALSARTIGELRELLRDLPAPRRGAGPPERLRPQARRSAFGIHLRVYAVVIGFLCLIWLFTGGQDPFWPIWPALGWGLALGLHKAIE